MKSRTTAILLCFFLGFFGIHRFYLGYTKIGIIQFLTVGGFGIWALFDFLRLFTGSLGPEGTVWKEEAEKERIEEEKEEKEREEERRIEVEKVEKEREEERRKREEEERKEAESGIRFDDMQEKFYEENDLEELQNGNLRDSDYQEYELVEYRQDFIEYKPEGLKGKRAYIKFEWGEGDAKYRNYLAWSGPITKGDKAKFLSGDFEKVKEESQPITEDATVQEQEGENVEKKQEKESETSDTTDEIVSSIEKLKELLDKGILTEEEYQKKKDELVSRI